MGKLLISVWMDMSLKRVCFFNDRRHDENKDEIIKELISYPNVVVSLHQAFLTKEASREITDLTIKNLDNWHEGKCSGKACICADGYEKICPFFDFIFISYL